MWIINNMISSQMFMEKTSLRYSYYFHYLALVIVLLWIYAWFLPFIIPLLPEGGGGFTVLPLSVLSSIQDIFRRIFLSNCWWQKSDIWSQASYRYTILWVAFLDPSDSYFLFADLVGFCTHWTYMHIFLSNYWWQRSDIWSQASYRYPISWEAFFDPLDSYFLFAEEWGYHRWALAHSSSFYFCIAVAFNLEIQLSRGIDCYLVNQFNPATFLCLSQARTWIAKVRCHGLFYVQWFEVRGCYSFCWYWWNCWPSLTV